MVMAVPDLVQKAGTIRGFCGTEQVVALYEAARDIPVEGQTVEIGCYLGRTTVALYAGLKERGKGEKVVVVDQFAAPPSDPKLEFFFRERDPDCQRDFEENMERLGVEYELHAMPASEAREKGVIKGPIRLAFIDGDHSYEGTKHDIEWLLPLMAPGGVMAFDDYDAVTTAWRNRVEKWGVAKAVRKILAPVAKQFGSCANGRMVFVGV